jgi:hypothetical protein
VEASVLAAPPQGRPFLRLETTRNCEAKDRRIHSLCSPRRSMTLLLYGGPLSLAPASTFEPFATAAPKPLPLAEMPNSTLALFRCTWPGPRCSEGLWAPSLERDRAAWLASLSSAGHRWELCPRHNQLFQLLSFLPFLPTALIRHRSSVWLISGNRWRKALHAQAVGPRVMRCGSAVRTLQQSAQVFDSMQVVCVPTLYAVGLESEPHAVN